MGRLVRRVLSLALVAGAAAATARFALRAGRLGWVMLVGLRRPLWRRPAELGLPAEDVVFRATDGVTLRGWFIRRAGDEGSPEPVVVLVHGWPWNRVGNPGGSFPFRSRTVDLLEPARALHAGGFHVLLFDLRNHGESGAAPPVTFGLQEASDFVGAVAMLRARADVDGGRLGAIGFSMGANAVLYGVPLAQPIRAVVAVQPVRVGAFADRFAEAVLGPLGPTLVWLAEPVRQALGAPPLRDVDPTRVAPKLGETAVLYVQGSGDPWGSLAEVEAMAAATPRAEPLKVVPTTDRFGGYRSITTRPEEIVAFFSRHL